MPHSAMPVATAKFATTSTENASSPGCRNPSSESWRESWLTGGAKKQCRERPPWRSTATFHPCAHTELHRLPHRGSNRPTSGNRVEELGEIERLVAVRERTLGVGMDFEDNAVGAGGDRGHRH